MITRTDTTFKSVPTRGFLVLTFLRRIEDKEIFHRRSPSFHCAAFPQTFNTNLSDVVPYKTNKLQSFSCHLRCFFLSRSGHLHSCPDLMLGFQRKSPLLPSVIFGMALEVSLPWFWNSSSHFFTNEANSEEVG